MTNIEHENEDWLPEDEWEDDEPDEIYLNVGHYYDGYPYYDVDDEDED